MTGDSAQPAGWYHASGDPVGTQRYWDGEMWQGDPVLPPGGGVAGQPGSPNRDYADWGTRVAATLIDLLIAMAAAVAVFIVVMIVSAVSETLGGIVTVLLGLPLVIAFLYVFLWLPGTTGTTPGRRIMGYEIVSERDGSYIGGGAFIGRQIVGGLIDNLCYINSLWPLWDDKNQMLADKIVNSVAVKTGKKPVMPIFPDGKPF